MKYTYPAIFIPTKEGYAVEFPDLFGCQTCGDTLAEALEMAEDALEMCLYFYEQDGNEIPPPSQNLKVSEPDFVNIIKADTEAYKKRYEALTTRKTLTIPTWLNNEALSANINFSALLQEALRKRLKV
ncbi:MAG: type II toxin-antitoxin system HicB family antitoxin [Oscillospiraceae bacterium]|jgi:predicted RNase H-like HicB family nuclease|nr:type II toxin-antitoxin system HicB family antitoxin [Oscillospiraceae bacterium]